MHIEQTIFWVSVFLLGYTYLGYPTLIWLWSRIKLAKEPKAIEQPSVSIVVVAHNEASRIEARIRNLLELDYPADRFEIIIASDASTDDTVAVAMPFQSEQVRVIEFTKRRGKPAVLNDVIPGLKNEITVLMDVRQRIKNDAVKRLVANFSDPDVGAVSGELVFVAGEDSSEVAEGVGFYWRYEKFIRSRESLVDSTVGVTGAIYALRHSLFDPVPADTVLDDVLIPMQVARQGYRVLFDPAAIAYDNVAATADAEFTRKVRTIAGNFQLFFSQPWLLNPFSNRLWFQTVSHKLCRLLGPLCLAAVFLTNVLLIESSIFKLFFGLQILFYLAATMGHVFKGSEKGLAILNIPYAFCLLNWATVMGFSRFVRGSQQVTWDKA